MAEEKEKPLPMLFMGTADTKIDLRVYPRESFQLRIAPELLKRGAVAVVSADGRYLELVFPPTGT